MLSHSCLTEITIHGSRFNMVIDSHVQESPQQQSCTGTLSGKSAVGPSNLPLPQDDHDLQHSGRDLASQQLPWERKAEDLRPEGLRSSPSLHTNMLSLRAKMHPAFVSAPGCKWQEKKHKLVMCRFRHSHQWFFRWKKGVGNPNSRCGMQQRSLKTKRDTFIPILPGGGSDPSRGHFHVKDACATNTFCQDQQ